MTTIAVRYNALVHSLMGHMVDDLCVDPSLDDASHIDEIVFRRSEYKGGMAQVLLVLAQRDGCACAQA